MTIHQPIRQVVKPIDTPNNSYSFIRMQAISLPCEPWEAPVKQQVKRCAAKGCNLPVAGNQTSVKTRFCSKHVYQRKTPSP